jgi:hypothetical protein
MRKRLAGLVMSASLTGVSALATASPQYPEELAKDLGLSEVPACAVCHPALSDDAAPPGLADTPFALSLVSRGLRADDLSSLRTAVLAMSEVDSDGDGARDLDELYWGGNPNQRDGPSVPPETPPSYGCHMASAPLPTRGHLGAWLIVLLARVTQSLPRIFLPSPRPINIDRVDESKVRRKGRTGGRNMQRRRRFLIAACLWGLVTLSGTADGSLGRPSDARVDFQAVGPAGLKIEGTTNDLIVSEDADKIVVTVPLANLKTGIEVRDRHMKEKYLEVEKYPEAKLTVARSAIKLPASGDKAGSDVTGSLVLHGQTKTVSVHYEVKAEGPAFLVDGKVHVNMKEVGIEVPVYLGVTVKPDVDVAVHFRIASSS